jgi:hypothetical protein
MKRNKNQVGRIGFFALLPFRTLTSAWPLSCKIRQNRGWVFIMAFSRSSPVRDENTTCPAFALIGQHRFALFSAEAYLLTGAANIVS